MQGFPTLLILACRQAKIPRYLLMKSMNLDRLFLNCTDVHALSVFGAELSHLDSSPWHLCDHGPIRPRSLSLGILWACPF
mmetsp:Transcript_145104/g.463592  ORF Transcript_145104/g.463592 Transcript_145104/m.463592 type:complete len:80 (+) Transcript_145104:205-444(+)